MHPPPNPPPAPRLAVAPEAVPRIGRAIFRHIWAGGRDGQDPESLGLLAEALGVEDMAARIADPAVKERLRRNTDEAIARGVFGVPTFVIGDELFWGEDVTGMMLDYLKDPELFRRGDLARLGDLPVAAERKESRLG